MQMLRVVAEQARDYFSREAIGLFVAETALLFYLRDCDASEYLARAKASYPPNEGHDNCADPIDRRFFGA